MMTKSSEFFMPMMPPTATAQEHKVMVKNGKPIFYDPPEVKDAKQKILSGLYPHKPQIPFTDGLRLTVKWLFPRGRHKDGEYRTSKPDTDNLQKMLKDCMTKLSFWTDDAIVCSEICEKFWAEVPGIYIKIEALKRVEENPCSDCGFYDEDSGCTCSPMDKWYACPLEPKLTADDLSDFPTGSEIS